jgi:glutamyl/glutaminyl-tRNA synthetase
LPGCSVTGQRSQPARAAARIIQPDLKAGEQNMANTATRVRIAPSPTGEPHVGTAYIALFNYLFAKKNGGEFILRIEDTDAARSTPEFEQKVLDALKWCGLSWSEGPDIGGPYGPYRQSERKDIYRPYVDKIVENGHGFRCFCTPERLDEMRAAQRAAGKPPKYDGRCLNLTAEEVTDRMNAGEPSVVRMKIPTEGSCKFVDGVYGEVEIPWEAVDMQVLLKADGMPTYHMANVVDDHLMKITHVARGEEWLASVPKHILIYQYLGLEPPVFMHLSLMRNADKSKLSKRKNPTSISYYAALGFLPEALMNFLGLFFIQIAEGEELLTMDQLVEFRSGKPLQGRRDLRPAEARLAQWPLAARERFRGGVHLPRTGLGTGKRPLPRRHETGAVAHHQALRPAGADRLPAQGRPRADRCELLQHQEGPARGRANHSSDGSAGS